MQGKSNDVLLFTKSTGINDSRETTGPQYNQDGITDLVKALNVTVTPEGKLVKVPEFKHKLTVSSTITDIVNHNERMFLHVGSYLDEFLETSVNGVINSSVLDSVAKAKYLQTPVALKIRANGNNYDLKNNSSALTPSVIGVYNGPVTSKVYNKMPSFEGGFSYNGRAYVVNSKFLQYSCPYNFDLFDLANDYIPFSYTILQAGAIPGCVITTHAVGVTVLTGTGPADFEKTFYPCDVISGTLFSGLIGKVEEYAHVFMCSDGVYIVTTDGKLTNLTVDNTDKLDVLNTVYHTVKVVDGKYLAFGDSVCVEYDLKVKGLYTRSNDGIKCSGIYQNTTYFGSGLDVVYLDTENDNLLSIPISVQLPYNDFGIPQYKQFRFLYFTGTITGSATVTVRNQYGDSVTKDISNIGYVQNYKIDSIRTCKGPKLSVEFNCTSGMFRLEELRGAYIPTSSRH